MRKLESLGYRVALLQLSSV